MGKTAFLFPGQGHGSVQKGMGLKPYRESRKVREMFLNASKILGFSLSAFCFGDSKEALQKTKIAQPASLVVGLAYARFLSKPADFLAGHSVGYITALVYSGVISFSEGVRIVKERARLMEQACKITPGKMVALIKPTDIKEVRKTCKQFGVEIANYNSSTQIVISGQSGSINSAVANILEKKLALEGRFVKVEGAFNSKQMRSIKVPFKSFLKKISFSDLEIPIIVNSNARIIKTGRQAKKETVKQIFSPVLWDKAMKVLVKKGVTKFFEVGHGQVLSKLLRRDLRKEPVEIFSTQQLLETA